MANSKKYDIERRTSSTDAVPSALQGDLYWYDTGTEVNGEKVLYDNTSKFYAYWYQPSGDEYIFTTIADVGNATPTGWFGDGGSGSFSGTGDWSGTMTSSSTVLADAWERAEATAFESLRNFTGCEENDDCFRGFLPVIGDADAYKSTDVWMMTSGSSGDFDNDRLAGSNALWCSLRSDARIESIWENRSDAMKFAGLVEAWLKETGNLEETGNIQWCRMTDIPSEPQVYRTDGKIREQYWIQAIDLELVYSTETTFS